MFSSKPKSEKARVHVFGNVNVTGQVVVHATHGHVTASDNSTVALVGGNATVSASGTAHVSAMHTSTGAISVTDLHREVIGLGIGHGFR